MRLALVMSYHLFIPAAFSPLIPFAFLIACRIISISTETEIAQFTFAISIVGGLVLGVVWANHSLESVRWHIAMLAFGSLALFACKLFEWYGPVPTHESSLLGGIAVASAWFWFIAGTIGCAIDALEERRLHAMASVADSLSPSTSDPLK